MKHLFDLFAQEFATIVISVANQKGGVAKTTSAHNIAAALAWFKGKRVLLIDLDTQSNLADSCGIEPATLEKSIFDVLEGAEPFSAILHLEKGLNILPANSNLAGAEMCFAREMGRENLLKKALKRIPTEAEYNFVLIDCPPSLGLLTINAFVASDFLLVPVQAEYHALSGLKQLMETLHQVKENDLNRSLEVLGLFVTMFDSRRKLNVEVGNALKPEWGNTMLATKIRDNVSLAEAPSHNKDIFSYRKGSYGSRDYLDLTTEILRNLKKIEKGRAA